jgi:hypothetical protein
MPPSIIVKSAYDVIRKERSELAQRVVAQFGEVLPDFPVLCFFDDQDWPALRGPGMEGNRGVFTRNGCSLWWEALMFVDGLRSFDNFIYLHGTTCSNEVGLVMTFAHELQHFFQYYTATKLYSENTVASVTLRNLTRREFAALGLRACDIPHEREARIVAKRIAEDLFGPELVSRHIEKKREEFITEQDAADWECIRGLEARVTYDLAAETKRFFPRLRSCRAALEHTLRELQFNDADFRNLAIDFDELLGWSA